LLAVVLEFVELNGAFVAGCGSEHSAFGFE
jgi:hypothetical protein